MTYQETVRYLFDLQFVGIKLGLDNIRGLCRYWNDPQGRYPVVHIAGTNGKGSTAAFLASMLQEAGYRTGLYTSPHLVDFSERIRVNGEPISAETVVGYTIDLRPEIDRLKATFFEATTAMAFRHFEEQGVDVAIVETGLGGRLDATNIVEPLLTVITSLSIDHVEYLGSDIREIAAEKGGIIKAGVPLLTAAEGDPLDVLQAICLGRNAPMQTVSVLAADCRIEDLDRMYIRFESGEGYRTTLVGKHQLQNAALARGCVPLLRAVFPQLDREAVRRGFGRVRENTGIRGRMERLSSAPEVVADVAHNAAGVIAMLDTWLSVRRPEKTHIVFGMLRNKDAGAVFSLLAQYSWGSVTLVAPKSHEALPEAELLELAGIAGIHASAGRDAGEAVRSRRASADAGSSILVFGSHYLVGPLLAGMKKN